MKGKTRRNWVCFHLSQNMFFKNTNTRKKTLSPKYRKYASVSNSLLTIIVSLDMTTNKNKS